MPSYRLVGGLVALAAASSALVTIANPAQAACAPPQYCGPPVVVPVSRTAANEWVGNADAVSSMSADGRYVAFSSRAQLVPEDTNYLQDVYRRDMETNTLVRVSVRADGGQANDWSLSPAISDDGRYVAFTSNASNLTAPFVFKGAPHTKSVFRKDLVTGAVVQVNLRSDGSAGGAYLAQDIVYDTKISMSSDGRYVAFFSTQTGLAGADSPNPTEVYRKDLTTGALVRVSMAGSTFGNGSSWHPSLSANGRYVAFASYASNFTAGDTNAMADVFRKDLTTGTIVRASLEQDGNQLGRNWYPSLSDDGRFVSFTAYVGTADNQGRIARKDLSTGALVTISTTANGTVGGGLLGRSAIAGDGEHVALETTGALVASDTNGEPDVYLKNVTTGAVRRVTRTSSGQQAPFGGGIPAISNDGTHVSFWTPSPLWGSDDDNAWDIYRTNLPQTV